MNDDQSSNGETAGGDLGGDIIAFLYEDLAGGTSDEAGAGAIENLRRRCLVGAQLVRRVGYDRARPYLLKLRELRRLICRVFEVPEAPLD